ncbi:adhesion G protein-coupled receptor L4-like [Dysidea avara]|uniref:adhesion G protein-coupled receptor L4-like n=1 Tax=Dysidea avara TaxID=196820 RepID=UPI003329E615
MNNGTCTDEVNSFTCNCVDGFTGENCTANIDDCDPNPCMNNGTCKDGVNSFTCNCVDGFIGDQCENACDEDFAGGLLWSKTTHSTTTTQSCSQLHPNFRSGVNIERKCLNNGRWSSVDLSSCTMFTRSNPVVMVSFSVNTGSNNTNAKTIVNQTIQLLNSSINYTEQHVYNYQHYISSDGSNMFNIVLSFDLIITPVPANIAEIITNILEGSEHNRKRKQVNVIYEDVEVSAFQPNTSCSCNTDTVTTIRTVCTGPSTPPCLCNSSQSCRCNSPTYVGDGNVCGLDSDSDGFPDVGLGCDQSQCVQDLCPDIYSVTSSGEQSVSFCTPPPPNPEFVGCLMERDMTWNITWPTTNISQVAIQKCPGGSEAIGLARRECNKNDTWGSPNVNECSTVEHIRLENKAEELSKLVDRIYVNDDRDLTQTFMPEVVEDIADELQEITNTTRPILPNDVSSAANTLGDIIGVTDITFDEFDQVAVTEVTEDIINVLDNLLDKRNDVSFTEMNRMNDTEAQKTVGEQLLVSTEEVGVLLSNILSTDTNETVMKSIEGNNNNVVISALVPAHEYLMSIGDIEFGPSNASNSSFAKFGDMSLSYKIPSAVILKRNDEEGRRIPIITGIARNPHLPTNESVRLKGLILSLQISTNLLSRVDLGNETVSLSFNIGMPGNTSRFNPRCAFFKISNNVNESGTFSTDGIIQSDTTNNTFVQCSTTHLTSFAVLVDAMGQPQVNQNNALSIVSYIGCAVSIICLLITISFYIILRKKVFNLVQHFVHLNLSIALLLGLITFVSGIETASDYRASCLIVAILLHYFFMTAFSWMLCEGILMFIMIKLVFYKGFFKRRRFFSLVGWGLPIPIVVVSAAVSHEQYGDDDSCWISEDKGAIWSFIGPMLLIIAVNTIFLLVTMYEIFKSSHSKLSTEKVTAFNTVKSLLKAAVIIVPLLGCTWVLGLLAVNEETVVFAWLFTITNSLQGLVILVLYVLRNEKFLSTVRNLVQRGTFQSHTYSTSARSHSIPKDKDSSVKDKADTSKSITLSAYNTLICNEYVQAASFSTAEQSASPNIFNTTSFADDDDFKRTNHPRTDSVTSSEYLKRYQDENEEPVTSF